MGYFPINQNNQNNQRVWFFWLFNYLVSFATYLSLHSITPAMPEINQIIKNNQRILIFDFSSLPKFFSTDRPTDQPTDICSYRSSLPELKKENFACVRTISNLKKFDFLNSKIFHGQTDICSYRSSLPELKNYFLSVGSTPSYSLSSRM